MLNKVPSLLVAARNATSVLLAYWLMMVNMVLEAPQCSELALDAGSHQRCMFRTQVVVSD